MATGDATVIRLRRLRDAAQQRVRHNAFDHRAMDAYNELAAEVWRLEQPAPVLQLIRW